MNAVRRSSAVGFGWLFWQRHRLGFCLLAGYLLLLGLASQLIPARILASPAIFGCAIPVGFGLLYLMGVFTYPEADIATTGSGYPPALLTLPVPTWALILWPMLYGTLTIALGWVALVEGVIMPRGGTLPVVWPAALLAALTTTLQAIFWSPVRLPYLRLLLTMTLLPALLFLTSGGVQNGVPSATLTSLLLACVPVAYLVALQGVARARRGEVGELSWLPEQGKREEGRGKSGVVAFASAAQAQVWHEWRRNGIMLPLIVGLACLLFSLPIYVVQETAPLPSFLLSPSSVGNTANLEINAYLKTYSPVLMMLPVFVAGIIGSGMRKSDNRRGDLTLHLFLATRPLTEIGMVAAKFQSAAISACAAWGVMLLVSPFWLLSPARSGQESGPLLLFLLPFLTSKTLLLAAVTLLFLISWTIRNQIVGIFADLSGRFWIANGYPIGVSCCALAVLVTAVNQYADHTEDLVTLDIVATVSRALALLVTLKLLGAAGALFLLHRLQRIPMRLLLQWTGVWALLALTLFAVLNGLLHNSTLAIPRSLMQHATFFTAATAILFVPLTRLLLAVLALTENRHR